MASCSFSDGDRDDSDFKQPTSSPPRKKSLSLSHRRKARFSMSSDEELEQARKGFVPANTVRCTDWAMRVFNAWRDERNKESAEKCPLDLLDNPQLAVLDKWLSAFVVEARREDGKQYPPNTINQLLAGLWRHVRSKTPGAPNFMNRKDHRFNQLNGAISSVFRKLREQGVGAAIKHAPLITPEEEEILWSTGTIGDHNPLALQRAVYYYCGKAFCLRGGPEQRGLKLSQLQRSSEGGGCYWYVEHGSKNISGTDSTIGNKIVPVYALPKEKQPRCLVYLLDTYIPKIPAAAKEKDLFYVRPVSKQPTSPTSRWYDNMAVGKEKLRTFIPDMFKDAGISERKTNHSLRATGTTAMFNASIPEKIIRGVTGHRSTALHLYERPSLEQQKAVSSVMMNSANQENQPVNNLRSSSSSVGAVQQAQACPPPSAIGAMFSGLSNCSISISPQNLIINLHSAQQEQVVKAKEDQEPD